MRTCAECATELGWLLSFRVAGLLELPEPPAGWVERAMAIPAYSARTLPTMRVLLAKLTFDSWATPQPVGVRGQATMGQRRVSFEASGFLFDLRAELRKDGWRFVAQTSLQGRSVGNLKAEKQILLPDENGIFQWGASRPPRRMSIDADGVTIELPELKWTKSRQKKPRDDS